MPRKSEVGQLMAEKNTIRFRFKFEANLDDVLDDFDKFRQRAWEAADQELRKLEARIVLVDGKPRLADELYRPPAAPNPSGRE